MSRPGRRLTEWGKNLLIALLSVSAVFLLGKTQIFSNEALSILPLGGQTEELSGETGWNGGTAMQPARIVITGPQGRAGVQYDREAVGEWFSELTNTLADALTSSGQPEETTAARFRAALRDKNPGVYLDFLGEIPLANLSGWLSGGRVPADLTDVRIRRLILTLTESGDVALYYIDEETGLYYMAKTAPELSQRLNLFVEQVVPNGAVFAFESGEPYDSLFPYTLLSGGNTPRLGAYAASNPVPLTQTGGESGYGSAVDALVRSLAFHPQSPSYPYGGEGGVTIQEGAEKLRISQTGTVAFEAADLGNPRFFFGEGKKELSRRELVGKAWAFGETVLSPLCGEAQLYIMDMEEDGAGSSIVLLGYQLDGAPVMVGREGYAARLEIRKGVLVSFRLQLRSYTYYKEGPAVLPELQAAAALGADGKLNRELMLYYPDGGGDFVTAQWGSVFTESW